ATAQNVVSATYTFEGVVPNSLGFYVIQTVGVEQSDNSNFVGVSLRTPAAAAGIGYVDVSNVLTGATLTLYDEGGSLISSSPADQGAGIWRYSGLTAGSTYYAIQSVNGVQSLNSSFVTLPSAPGAPTNVTAAGGNGQAVITFTPPTENGGSAITGYKVIVLPDNITVTGTASPMTITGLINGKRYTFQVIAINAVGHSELSSESNAVTPGAPSEDSGSSSDGDSSSSSSSSSSGQTSTPASNTGVNVLVNGRVENAGTATTKDVNGQQTVTIAVDDKKLLLRLEAEGPGTVITIPLTMESDAFIAEFNGNIVKQMEAKQAIVELHTGRATYTLPAWQMNMDSISERIGKEVELQDIKIRIEIAAPLADTLRRVEQAAVQGQFDLAAPPVEFRVTAVYGDRTVEVTQFSTYVERTIVLPDGTDPNKITTGVVVDPDGTVRHVPTQVVAKDGTYAAQIKSLTNSTYSIIWHPLEFTDVTSHWAKEAVNNMGSRLVIHGTGDGVFSPDREITRAEFAAIMVRGLGLKLEDGSAVFSDVQVSDWYSSAIHTAYAYGLINGYEDGTFRPNDKITREQAMVILAKAMTVTGLAANAAANVLHSFSDAAEASDWAASGITESVGAGIVSGRAGGELAPQAYITRAEVAAMVERLLKKSDLI
ncbi:S-layer homology domain-containing protein, partial [Paenibacillus sp. y28]|uniref:S-layer homology domain-containing protein n=1 Tax=Paenibacillus sp. y28 TaxID=3129110 RepID=UPI00301A3231